MKPVPGLCDRCGLRYPLSELKVEFVLGRPTNLRTCPECYDESHPQLDTRNVRTDDLQTVKDSRSDLIEIDARGLWGFNPVRGSYIRVTNGRASVG